MQSLRETLAAKLKPNEKGLVNTAVLADWFTYGNKHKGLELHYRKLLKDGKFWLTEQEIIGN